ncbi:arginine N-succinyltransferase [Rhodopirellula sp.]|nr:arginine N-succinyltransferase [Rhodopirellula sp.]MDA7907096.1 arginine N-succinyltransferase [bacterium]
MWIVRSVRIEDIDALFQLAQSATKGLTSLQLDRARLLDRVEQSTFAFSRTGISPRGEPYVLVLVNSETGELVGTSTVYAKTGGYQPLYAYRRVESDHQSELLGVSQHRVRLDLERIHDGPTEIGSLFLRGIYRGEGRGRWLSLARFALISMLPHRFADRVIAQMRGRSEPDGSVPFWDAVAGRFIPVDFAIADAMSTISKQFIEEMMPQHPIYLELLAKKIRDGIGQVHTETEPAVAMLKAEGFTDTDLFDIFDAGPVISAETKSILAVKRTRSLTVGRVVNQLNEGSTQAMVASGEGGFTSVLTEIRTNGDTVDLLASDAKQLRIESGSQCVLMTLRPDQ